MRSFDWKSGLTDSCYWWMVHSLSEEPILNPTLCLSLVLFGIALGVRGESTHDSGEWRYWGGDAGSMRYVPFDQINGENFKDLEIAWRWKSRPLGDNEQDWN